MRQLAVKLDSDPRLRCKDVQSGIELVKQGSYVFIDVALTGDMLN